MQYFKSNLSAGRMEALRADTQMHSDDPTVPFTLEQRTRVARAAQLLSHHWTKKNGSSGRKVSQ